MTETIADGEGKPRRMLVVTFEDDPMAIAVLDVDEAAKGNVYMYPAHDKPGTGNNAWRGDRFKEAAEAVRVQARAEQ